MTFFKGLFSWKKKGKKQKKKIVGSINAPQSPVLIEVESAENLEKNLAKSKERGKIVFLGDSGVGKTCVIKTYLDKYPSMVPQTTGVDISKTAGFDIYDLPGLERVQVIIPLYLDDVAIAMLCYDITDSKSFENIAKWRKLLGDKAKVTVLVGAKNDLEEKRAVSAENQHQY
jgi:small GTP-binding protein